MKVWTHEEHTRAAGAEVTRMAEAVSGRDMTVPVPTCPGWDVGALVAHTGAVHRWAAAMVRDLAERRYDRDAMDLGLPDDRGAYPGWLAEGADPLTAALASQDPAAPVWSWVPERQVRFWSRRQLHETAMHRADAQIALGVTPDFDEDVAADGVDEFFGLLPHTRWRPAVRELTGDGETLSWQADTGAGWLVTLNPEGFTWERSAMPGDVTVRAATSADVLLLAYGRRRPGDYAVEGDDTLLAWWLERSAF